jgi:hypothetical protein
MINDAESLRAATDGHGHGNRDFKFSETLDSFAANFTQAVKLNTVTASECQCFGKF